MKGRKNDERTMIEGSRGGRIKGDEGGKGRRR